ncbi:MAG: histidine--tRNA ligase [Alphaproteobacteria bacterium]|nr:histidine--tRNA ligase [Alphaproteobacteria bacterium]|tara:strand:+ start:3030 stop:4346 length:1317 start_codon:yes stop_codon:yes gene_type:complete
MSKVFKPSPISGFPEYLPEIRRVEQQWIDHIRAVFESYGFCNIETPAVEEVDVLMAKGETDKEIYCLNRLQADPDDNSDARLALHFDQTVPLARYTAQHFNDLVFPFKRYQIQKVWRGERPQVGRMREFYQCDIDVIAVDNLPLHFDAEMPAVIYEALMGLNIGKVQIKISNRRILIGLLESLGIEDVISTTRIIDKLDKIGVDGVTAGLKDEIGLTDAQIASVLALSTIKTRSAAEVKDKLSALNVENEAFQQGVDELCFVLDYLSSMPEDAMLADLSIVRGLDYYTGTVYETNLLEIPEFTSSVCSGGRYDDLASSYINKKLPGVGISIGLTRLFSVLLEHGYIKAAPRSPADILMAIPSEEKRGLAQETAQALRKRGFKVELYHAPQKIKKQLSYAEKKSIPFVWFPPFEDGQSHEVKNMDGGEQIATTVESFTK